MGKKKKKSKKNKGGITAQDRAVLDLKNARDKLRRFQARLDFLFSFLDLPSRTRKNCDTE